MKYFIPSYIIKTSNNDNIILENTLNQSIVELSIEFSRNFDILLKNGCNYLKTKLEKLLYQQGFLIKRNINRKNSILINKVMDKTLFLTITLFIRIEFLRLIFLLIRKPC